MLWYILTPAGKAFEAFKLPEELAPFTELQHCLRYTKQNTVLVTQVNKLSMGMRENIKIARSLALITIN